MKEEDLLLKNKYSQTIRGGSMWTLMFEELKGNNEEG